MTTKETKYKATHVLKKILGPVSFGQMIQAHRLSLELSQVEMAKILSISKQDLCNIEKERKLVSVDRAIGFARKLKMPIKIFAKYVLQDQLNRAGIKGVVSIMEAA